MDPERKAAFTPVDDPEVTDDELTKAAAAAVDEDQVVADNPVEDPAKIIKEVDDEPDHKARSDLGRKFSALHRRQDEFDSKIDKLLDVMTKSAASSTPVEEEFDEEVPMTKAEAREYFKKLKQEDYQETTAQKTKHQNDYDNMLVDMSSEYSDAEANAIFEELQTMRYNPTSDGARDAEVNFLKAERAYLRKKTAKPVKKDVPLKHDPVTGVATSQKTVSRETAPVKLNSAGESYLQFVARKDGAEKAQNLRKGL